MASTMTILIQVADQTEPGRESASAEGPDDGAAVCVGVAMVGLVLELNDSY
jgi:hypothetical protein